MKITAQRIPTLLLALLLGPGCAANRVADLQDCGRVSVGFGIGLGAHVKAGALTHPSLGVASAMRRYGHDDRTFTRAWEERECLFPLITWGGFALNGFLGSPPDPVTTILNRSYFRERNHLQTNDHSPDVETEGRFLLSPLTFNSLTDVQVGVALICISLRVGLNPLEIADWLLGCAGLDFAGDDAHAEDNTGSARGGQTR